MASIVSLCFDGSSFSLASSLYTDNSLSTLAPDGYYSQGQIVRRQLNGVLLNAQPCSACLVECGTGVSETIGNQNGIFNADIDLGSSTGAVVLYFFMGSSVPDGVIANYNLINYNRLTAKDNHNGVILKNGADVTVDYAGIANQGTNIPTYVGNQNTALVGSYTNAPVGSCSQGDRPQNYNLVSGSYDAQGTFESITVVNNQVGFSDDASSISSPVFAMVVPKTSITPTNINLKIFAPMCGTAFGWEIACPVALPSFTASAEQSTLACAAATTTYYFLRNATGTTPPFTISTNTVPEIGNFVFSNSNGATYLNDTNTIKYYIIANTTAIGVRNGVVVSSASCSGGGGGTNTAFFGTSGTSSLADGMCNVNVANLLYHDGSGTLPQAGDTIYSGSSPSSSTVTWTNYKGFNPADVGGGSTSSGTVNASGVIQLIALCP